jgi:hypothetical protein
MREFGGDCICGSDFAIFCDKSAWQLGTDPGSHQGNGQENSTA